ncbi:chymotrypsin-2 isoform X2 [Plutella xylostella]|uniref:chymotrypsin-2 isoform X2 n=1 Tax=Plutella xylostella TaxID=51655 RepID=UPI0020324531|nr:chymotrypsin-2 isoform X2 [Plutella xylostella]
MYVENMYYLKSFYIILSLLFSLELLRAQNLNMTTNITTTRLNENKELLANEVNDEQITRRVVNGVEARLGQVPFYVALKRGWWLDGVFNYVTYCGGTLVAPAKIITAAHCFIEMKPMICEYPKYKAMPFLSHTFAVMGQLTNFIENSPKMKKEGQWRKLKNFTYHSGYYLPFNDIGILFTTRPFILNQNVNIINYARRHKEYTGHCTVAGMGITEEGTQSVVLLIAPVEVIGTNDCKKRMSLIGINHNYQQKNMYRIICSTIYKTNTGQGDSGGPLFCSKTGEEGESSFGILVGVVSGEMTHFEKHKSIAFYTRISRFADYIDRNEARPMMQHTFHSIHIVTSIGILIFRLSDYVFCRPSLSETFVFDVF